MASVIGVSSQTYCRFLGQSKADVDKAKSLLGNTTDTKVTEAFSRFQANLGLIRMYLRDLSLSLDALPEADQARVKDINICVKTIQEAVSSQTLGTTLDQAMAHIATKVEENKENAFKAFYAVSSIKGVCSSELTTSLDKLSQENQEVVAEVNTVVEMILSEKNPDELGEKIEYLGIPGNVIRIIDIKPHDFAVGIKPTKAFLTFLGSFPKREEMAAALTLSGKTFYPLPKSTSRQLKFEVEIKNVFDRTLEGSLKIRYDLGGLVWPFTWYAKEATFNILLRTYNSPGRIDVIDQNSKTISSGSFLFGEKKVFEQQESPISHVVLTEFNGTKTYLNPGDHHHLVAVSSVQNFGSISVTATDPEVLNLAVKEKPEEKIAPFIANWLEKSN